MPSIEKEPIYDMHCISRRQYQRFLNILFWGCLSGAVASMSGVVLGGVVMSRVRISLEAKYLQHLSAQLIHYIPLYICKIVLAFILFVFVCGRVPWLDQYWPGGFMLFVVLCPGTPEGSTGSGSGFKASQKTGQRLKVSSDRLGEAGNRLIRMKNVFLYA